MYMNKKTYKIGFQGTKGSFAEKATEVIVEQKHLQAEMIALLSSYNVVQALMEHKIDYGVMAIRNSIAGVVVETQKALNDDIELLEQIQIPICHCLFVKSADKQIRAVASHIQALKQTKNTRNKILKETDEIECADTAIAAKMLHDGEFSDDVAVICSKKAGEFYGLKLYAQNIADDPSNRTTFGFFRLK